MKTAIKPVSTLLLLSMFCFVLEIARMYRSERITYVFLLWNLLLAWVPYVIGHRLHYTVLIAKPKWIQWLVFLLWLLFFPNTIYLMSDLIHLHPQQPTPLWYDAFLLNAFAWNGLLLAIFSLHHAHSFLNIHLSESRAWLGTMVIVGLSGLGVYMGRYLRFNSWDVFINPFEIIFTLAWQLSHPFYYHTLWIFSTGFAVLLLLSYCLFYFSISKNQENEYR